MAGFAEKPNEKPIERRVWFGFGFIKKNRPKPTDIFDKKPKNRQSRFHFRFTTHNNSQRCQLPVLLVYTTSMICYSSTSSRLKLRCEYDLFLPCEGEILSLLVDAEAPSSSLRWLGGFNLLPTAWSVQGEYSLQSEEQEGMQFKFQAQYPQLVPPRTTSASSSHLCKELQLKRAPIVYYWCCGHDSKSCI